MKHVIVALEGIHSAIPSFEIPDSTTIVHQRTSPDELRSRIHDATVIICTTVKLTAAILDPDVTPNLQLVAVMASGTDHVDLAACKKRGITVCNTPGAMVDSVAEHTLALYFATRRSVPLMHRKTVGTNEWPSKGTITSYMRSGDGEAPVTCGEEICGIIGYGKIGRRIAHLTNALGMKVLIADRKSMASPTAVSTELPLEPVDLENPVRTPFATVIARSTVLIVVCPLNSDTKNLISEAEISSMLPSAVIINVSRGGVVDEVALASALKQHRIAGAASDVFSSEPAVSESNPLLGSLGADVNFIASPHVAWFSTKTITNVQKLLKSNVENWAQGNPQHVIV